VRNQTAVLSSEELVRNVVIGLGLQD
jgi:hypothetical protein